MRFSLRLGTKASLLTSLEAVTKKQIILSIFFAPVLLLLLLPSVGQYLPSFSDKVYHILMGASTLPVLLMLFRRRLHLFLSATFLYTGTELLQKFTGRTPDVHDIMCNLTGAFLGYILYLSVRATMHCIKHSEYSQVPKLVYRYNNFNVRHIFPANIYISR